MAVDPFKSSYQAQVEGLMPGSDYTVWSLLANGNVLFTGSTSSLSTCFLDCSNNFVCDLPNTREMQPHSGIATVGNCVFLMGGVIDVGLKSVEIFDLMENRWTYAPDMIFSRSHFQPAVWGRYIYALGGLNTEQCERLDLQTMQFESLKPTIPGRKPNVTYCHGDVFYIFTRMVMYRWDQKGALAKVKDGLSIEFYSNINPVKVRNSIYFISQSNSDRYLMQLDLESLKLDISLTFPSP